jgi:2'-5' RNA ligase
LGRIKVVKNSKKLVSKLRSAFVNGRTFKINDFSLIKSTLTKDGPIYEEIASFGNI